MQDRNNTTLTGSYTDLVRVVWGNCHASKPLPSPSQFHRRPGSGSEGNSTLMKTWMLGAANLLCFRLGGDGPVGGKFFETRFLQRLSESSNPEIKSPPLFFRAGEQAQLRECRKLIKKPLP